MIDKQTAPTRVRRGNRTLTGLLTAMLVLAAPTLRAAVDVSLDRNSVYSGDTVTLSIETSGDDRGQQPDLSPLKQDFDILGTSTSQQIQIINGQRADRNQWLVELGPLHTGTLTVPALKVGNTRTQVLVLKVSDPPSAAHSQAGQPVFIQSEATPSQGSLFVQQQILYTTRLFYRVPLIEGDFSDPKLDNAAVERLGDDHQYQTTVDGQHYQVLERRYAIFPENSGVLTIPPTQFSGRMVSTVTQSSPFGRADAIFERMLGGNPFKDRFFAGTPFGDPGKRVHLRGDAVTLAVKPRPAAYQGHDWLPTEKLVLHDSWAESPPEFRSGEPVTRTITLEAKGLEAAQLPDIHMPETAGLRVYPESPVQTNRTDGDWIYGRSEQTFAFLATEPGRITLPRIRVDWWDSVAQKQQTAILPGWDVMVAAGSGAAVNSTPSAAPGSVAAAPATTPAPAHKAATAPGANPPAAAESTPPALPVRWLIAAAVLLVLVLVLTLLARRRRQPPPASAVPPASGTTENPRPAAARQARQGLRNACMGNNPQTAARSLLDWGLVTWPQQPPRSLGALARRVTRGAELIRELETVLYAPGKRPWIGEPLWQALEAGLQVEPASTSRHPPGDAPPLYPDWTRKAV